MRLHTENNVTYCHYFNNDKKFPHKEAKNCPFKSNCTRRLWPYKHEVTRNAKDDNNGSDENVEMSDITESDKSATDSSSFITSTPPKRDMQCEEFMNGTQCTDCYVRLVMTGQIQFGGQSKPHRVHFSDK